MKFITAAYTDVGARKKTNQDSLLIMQASTDRGPVLLACVCDGMGGLAKGEVASASMIQALARWFTQKFPPLLACGLPETKLWQQWDAVITNTGDAIRQYGDRDHIRLGTTCAALLIAGGLYYTVNAGDSRIYLLSDTIYQLTKDQSFVQREVDAGRMTQVEALTDNRRNILLQCVGAGPAVQPVFGKGTVRDNQVFMLCSDGFRHEITPQEFYQAFRPDAVLSKESMQQKMKELTELNISRGESDNISVIIVKT